MGSSRLKFILLLQGLLLMAGCAGVPAPAPATDVAKAETGKRLQGQDPLARTVQDLQDRILILEARLRDQQQTLEDLRATLVAQKVTSDREKTAISATSPSTQLPSSPAGRTVSSPTEIYLQAFADYASGRYPEAIQGFETFLRLFPGSDYAGNAQYWLGECFYAQQQYPQAADAFRAVADRYPQGSKAPDALLKLAEALQKTNQPERAREVLQTLRERYPGSAAAKKMTENP